MPSHTQYKAQRMVITKCFIVKSKLNQISDRWSWDMGDNERDVNKRLHNDVYM